MNFITIILAGQVIFLLTSVSIKVILFIILGTIFFSFIYNEATRYPLHINGAQSRSAILNIWGTACGKIEYKMIYDTLYMWNEEECDQKSFYITAGYWWAKLVCSGYNCIKVSTP